MFLALGKFSVRVPCAARLSNLFVNALVRIDVFILKSFLAQ